MSQGTAEFDEVDPKQVVEVLIQDQRPSTTLNDDEILIAEEVKVEEE